MKLMTYQEELLVDLRERMIKERNMKNEARELARTRGKELDRLYLENKRLKRQITKLKGGGANE